MQKVRSANRDEPPDTDESATERVSCASDPGLLLCFRDASCGDDFGVSRPGCEESYPRSPRGDHRHL